MADPKGRDLSSRCVAGAQGGCSAVELLELRLVIRLVRDFFPGAQASAENDMSQDIGSFSNGRDS